MLETGTKRESLGFKRPGNDLHHRWPRCRRRLYLSDVLDSLAPYCTPLPLLVTHCFATF